jgi:hypothetical protein
MSGMTAATPPVMQRWLRAIENWETADLEDLLAEDAVFYSPAVFTPQRGRATTLAYLRAAEQMFSETNFHYVEKWYGENSAVLHFAAEVGGLSMEGIDMIHWNDEGSITSVKVMIRPFKALQAVIGKMAELLAAH